MMDDFRANRNALVVALVFAFGLIACAQLLCGAEQKTNDEVLFFHATWCGPCRVIEPTVRQLANQVAIRDVDVDHEPALTRRFKVRQVPTLVRLHDGQEEARLVGQASAAQLRNFLQPRKGKK